MGSTILYFNRGRGETVERTQRNTSFRITSHLSTSNRRFVFNVNLEN